MTRIFMFVNIDWFFLSHRLPIALAAKLNNVDMSVYTDFSRNGEIHNYKDFNLFQSPIKRSSKFYGLAIIEFLRAYFLIRKEKPDLIHAVTIKPIILLGIIAKLTRTPFVGAISGLGPVINQKNWLQRLRFRIVLLIYKLIYSSNYSRIICQSEHDKNLLLKFRIIPESRISIIPGSGVDLEKFKPNLFKDDQIVILMASRMLLDKGIKEFCASSKYLYDLGHKNIKFRLAGPLDELSPSSISDEELRLLCADSEVEYLGDRSDVNILLASTSIFIMPSYYPEGIPKVLLEAAACGTPVITTDHPGCRDAVIKNKTGILVEPRNSQAIVKAILYMLDRPETLIKMGKAGRKLAEDCYDEKSVIDAHFEIYQQYT